MGAKVGKSDLICLSYQGEEEKYDNTKAFVGDSVRIFTVNGYVDGVLTEIVNFGVRVNAQFINFNSITGFNVYSRGNYYRSIFKY